MFRIALPSAFLLVSLMFSPFSVFAQVSEDDLLREIAPQAVGGEAKGDLEEPFKIAMDATVTLNYVFAESPDSFVVTYKIHLEGDARNKVDIIKGKGRVTADVKGFLAKWPTGECALKIGIGEFPFEMIFSKVEEEKVRLDLKITEPILENWESNCKFLDAPGSKFNTKGSPEKWVDGALKRTNPLLRDLQLPIDRLHRDTTTLGFTVDQYLLPDPPLGSVEISGKGTVTASPE